MIGLGSDRQTVEFLISKASLPVAGAIDRVLAGQEPSFDDALALAGATDRDLDAMIAAADYLRRRVNGDVVTYVVNRNIQFTNVCTVGCKFCAFSVGPRDRRAQVLSPAAIAAKVREARAAGATEVCIQGGIDPTDDPHVYRDVVRAVKQADSQMHLHAFSPLEILVGQQRTGMALADYLRMLREEGLDSIPGTAAEILDDAVRARISPLKLKAAQWVEVVSTAHAVGLPSSATMMYGHVEEPVHWARHIITLRQIQQRTGGFTEFVPLGFVHTHTALWRQGACRPGPTLIEDLRVHAFGRLMLHGLVDHIQVSWVKLGHRLALTCLMAGADDYGGTLMEESISRLAGATTGEVAWPDQIRDLVQSIGRLPAERTTTYGRVARATAAPGVAGARGAAGAAGSGGG